MRGTACSGTRQRFSAAAALLLGLAVVVAGCEGEAGRRRAAVEIRAAVDTALRQSAEARDRYGDYSGLSTDAAVVLAPSPGSGSLGSAWVLLGRAQFSRGPVDVLIDLEGGSTLDVIEIQVTPHLRVRVTHPGRDTGWSATGVAERPTRVAEPPLPNLVLEIVRIIDGLKQEQRQRACPGVPPPASDEREVLVLAYVKAVPPVPGQLSIQQATLTLHDPPRQRSVGRELTDDGFLLLRAVLGSSQSGRKRLSLQVRGDRRSNDIAFTLFLEPRPVNLLFVGPHRNSWAKSPPEDFRVDSCRLAAQALAVPVLSELTVEDPYGQTRWAAEPARPRARVAVGAQRKASEIDFVHRLLGDAQEATAAAPHAVREALQHRLALAWSRLGDVARARRLAQEIYHREPTEIDIALSQALAGNRSVLDEFVQERRRMVWDESEKVAWAKVYARIGDVAAARALYREAFARFGDPTGDHAQDLWDIARLQVEAGDFEGGALETFRAAGSVTVRARPHLMTPGDVVLSYADVFATVAIGQAFRGNLDGAIRTVEANPDGPPRYLAWAFARVGKTPRALQIVDAATQEAVAAGMSPERVTALATEIRFGVIQGQIERGDVAGALRTAAALPDGARPAALAAIAVAQAWSGDSAEALKAAERLPDDPVRTNALAWIARAQARAGNAAGALKTARSVGAEADPSVLVPIARAQARAGDAGRALQSLEGIPSDWPLRVEALVDVALTAAAAGKRAAAVTVLERARQLALEADLKLGIERVAAGYAAIGDLDTAVALTAVPGVARAFALMGVVEAVVNRMHPPVSRPVP